MDDGTKEHPTARPAMNIVEFLVSMAWSKKKRK